MIPNISGEKMNDEDKHFEIYMCFDTIISRARMFDSGDLPLEDIIEDIEAEISEIKRLATE